MTGIESFTHLLISVGASTIIAPPNQFGMINTSTSLNCSTIYGEISSIATSWYRDEARTQPTSGVFDRVSLGNEGMYVCRLFISSLNLETTKMINFTVIGENSPLCFV